jgi:hypothetical protein
VQSSPACVGSLDRRFRSRLTTSLVLTTAKPRQLPTSASDTKRTSELAGNSCFDPSLGKLRGRVGETVGARVFVGLFTGRGRPRLADNHRVAGYFPTSRLDL